MDAENQTGNIVFCGLDPIDVRQRVCALSALKRKYVYYSKRPEKYVIKNEGYVRVKSQKSDGRVVNHPTAWTNYDDYVLSKAILDVGYGNCIYLCIYILILIGKLMLENFWP